MKTTLEAGSITLDDGKCSRTMTLEQYEKHARSPEFVQAMPADKHDEAMAARAVEVAAAVEAEVIAAASR